MGRPQPFVHIVRARARHGVLALLIRDNALQYTALQHRHNQRELRKLLIVSMISPIAIMLKDG